MQGEPGWKQAGGKVQLCLWNQEILNPESCQLFWELLCLEGLQTPNWEKVQNSGGSHFGVQTLLVGGDGDTWGQLCGCLWLFTCSSCALLVLWMGGVQEKASLAPAGCN